VLLLVLEGVLDDNSVEEKDNVLERVKGWKMRNNYNNIDGWGGDGRWSTTKIKNSRFIFD
jgi:hypothetical protein